MTRRLTPAMADPAVAADHGSVRVRGTSGLAAVTGTMLVATVLLGGQMLTSAGLPGPPNQPLPPVATQTGHADDCKNEEASSTCGNDHSAAIRVWVKCKADKGKEACPKPQPPGLALGHTKHAGQPPGPASAHGLGHGWGRAHAPGQLKSKDKPDPDDQDADDQDDGKAPG